MARVLLLVGARTRRKCILRHKALRLKTEAELLLSAEGSRASSESLNNTIIQVVAWARKGDAPLGQGVVSLLCFEGGCASCLEHAVVLLTWLARSVLTWTQLRPNRLLIEALYVRTKWLLRV